MESCLLNCFCFFSALLIRGLLFDGWTRAVFDTAPLMALGRYSYFMYLYHLPISVLVNHLLSWMGVARYLGVPAIFAIQMIGILLCAHFSYVFFESPILRAKNFFRYAHSLDKGAI